MHLFISDLHLDPRRPHTTQALLQLLQGTARQAEALYILGDLFEAWIGDDEDSALAEQVASALAATRLAGVALYFCHGNRDFLLGTDYAQRAGLQLLPESSVVELYGVPTLLAHGDQWCTDDVDYQRLRLQLRSPQWQAQILALPLAERRVIAARLREQSREAQSYKELQITDVNPQAITQALQQYGVTRIIHGHTHRPAIHRFEHQGQPAQRIVLGDWYEQSSLLRVTAADTLQLESN